MLLFRTLDALRSVDPGFDPSGLLVFTVNPEPQGYTTDDAVRLHLALLERARGISGVQAVSLTRTEPFYPGDIYGWVVASGGDRESDRLQVQHEWIGPDYFSTLGHAVVGWTVTERTREIGIRIAVGANPGRVAAWVVRGAAGLAGAGVLVGHGASILVARLLESRLFGVEPFDPITWAASAGALLIVAAAAAARPALRAAAVSPVEALRSD